MSCKELIESLKQSADERVRKLWQDAEVEIAEMRKNLSARIEQLRNEKAEERFRAADDLAKRAVAEAINRARTSRLSAEKQVSDQLYAAAREMLTSLRNASYEKRFGLLARELPDFAWEQVEVNGRDADLAHRNFPGATVVVNDHILGGMLVSALQGAITIDNTFEKRLERAWVDLRPDMIRDVYLEVKDEAASAAAPGQGVSGRVPSVENQREKIPSDL